MLLNIPFLFGAFSGRKKRTRPSEFSAAQLVQIAEEDRFALRGKKLKEKGTVFDFGFCSEGGHYIVFAIPNWDFPSRMMGGVRCWCRRSFDVKRGDTLIMKGLFWDRGGYPVEIANSRQCFPIFRVYWNLAKKGVREGMKSRENDN